MGLRTLHKTAAPAVTEFGASGHPKWVRTYIRVLVVSDAIASIVAGLTGLALRGSDALDALRLGSFEVSYPLVVLLLTPVWLVSLGLVGAYDPREIGNGSEEYRRVFDAALRLVFTVALLNFLLRLQIARGFVGVMAPVGLGLTVFARYRVRKWVHRKRETGGFTHKVIVVGSREHARDLVRHLLRSPHAGLRVIGVCVPGAPGELIVDDAAVPILGTPEQAEAAVALADADAVAISDVANLASGALRRIAWSLEGTGVDLIVAPALTDLAGPRIAIRPVSGLPLLHVEEPVLSGLARVVKQVVDRVLAAGALLVLAPAFLVISLLIIATDGRPVFYRQTRVGRDGRHFSIWKFRTMYNDADERRAEILHLNEHDGLLFKIRNDPRVTPFGRWLRRFSLDELPQIVHVVTGHMSVVGPRPPLPTEVEQYDDHTSRRLLVKPGLTGLWQVSGRADLGWDESVRLDLYYVENWTPALDAVILWKTIAAVIQGRGAY